MKALRKRIEQSELLARVIGGIMSGYVRVCVATSKWDTSGLESLEADLADGPVLCMAWHGRLLMIGPHWPLTAGNLSCLHDTSPVGRSAGALQAAFGLLPMAMSQRRSNLAMSRSVITRAKEGVSIGITADGPLGPSFVVKDAPLEWARTLQRPVYGYAFSTRRRILLNTWDKMMVPLPFTRGAIVFSRIDVNLPRKASADQIEVARIQMQVGLDALTAEADSVAG